MLGVNQSEHFSFTLKCFLVQLRQRDSAVAYSKGAGVEIELWIISK
jgi:hypothetical protein